MDDLISRKQAIEAMCALVDGCVCDDEWKENPHIDAIVDTLENLPSAQPDSKDLIKKIKNGITVSDGNNEYFIGLRNGMRWCLSLIDDKEPIYEPSALQETHEKRTGTHACDLISRAEAIAKFEPWLKVKGYSEGELNMLKAVLYELTIMPPAQPELIEKASYVRGFEQGRTQGMIDSQGQWISCSERLPEEDTEVLISYRYKEGEGDADHVNIDITSYGTTCFGGIEIHTLKEWRQPFDYFHANYEVIAWMPLPTPYREE